MGSPAGPPDTLTFPKSYHFVAERELLLFLKLGDHYAFQTLCTNYMFFPSLRNSEYIYLLSKLSPPAPVAVVAPRTIRAVEERCLSLD